MRAVAIVAMLALCGCESRPRLEPYEPTYPIFTVPESVLVPSQTDCRIEVCRVRRDLDGTIVIGGTALRPAQEDKR